MKKPKIIISGGGTGGHIFPAIAIADALKEVLPEAEILFVGAVGKMEMERVPQAGYKIIGLPIRGFQRKRPFTLFSTLLKLFESFRMANRLLKQHQPDVAIGVGGYASAAILYQAARRGIPTLIQEQNSYPGITNKLLARRAKKICVAYDNMERFFAQDRLILTGNPIRQELLKLSEGKHEAYRYFNLDTTKETVLVVGGSLGAKTLNESLKLQLELLGKQDFQVIWQSGAFYYEQLHNEIADNCPSNVHLFKFVNRMDLGYAVADLIVARSGALTISELSALGKPAILVPSPNVAEDHQTKNAMALVTRDAAVLIKDSESREKLVPTICKLMQTDEKRNKLAESVCFFGKPSAAKEIANEVLKLI